MADRAMPELEMRAARLDDVAGVLELIAPFVSQRKLLPRDRADIERLIPHGFVVEVASQIVGFAAVEIYSRKLAEIQTLAVATPFQRRGLARRLIQLCVQRARDNGVQELMAITSSESLFREFGFDYSLPDQKRALFLHPLTDEFKPLPHDQ